MQVSVYSKAGCPGCENVKALLRQMGVAYEERRIDSTPAHLDALIAMGIRSVPVTVVEGAGHVIGYNPEAIRELLAKAGLSG